MQRFKVSLRPRAFRKARDARSRHPEKVEGLFAFARSTGLGKLSGFRQ
jgi:hypothetical protein